MPATILVKDALARICGQLGDAAPQFGRWTERNLVRYIRDAEVAITVFMPQACTRIGALRLKPGTLQSIEAIDPDDFRPSDGSTPSAVIQGTQLIGVVRNMGKAGDKPGQAIRATDRDVLDAVDPLWHTRAGPVVRSVCFKAALPKVFFVTPGVPPTRLWVDVELCAMPAPLPEGGPPGSPVYAADGENDTKLSVADENLSLVVDYACARAHMEEVKWADKAIAAGFTSLFTGAINARVTALTGHNPNLTRLPFVPEPAGAAQ